MKGILLSPLLFILFLFACKKDGGIKPQVTVYKASGAIQPKLDEFRAALGKLNTLPGALTGRREINWDGVPDSLLDKPLAKDFFNPTGAGAPAARQRGFVIGPGNFQVSATAFSQINKAAASEFSAFSGDNTYANVDESLWPVGFQVAGQTTPASVTAFGMVFSDVDVEGSVTLEFFDGATSLGTFSPPAHDESSSFSFLGVQFHNRTVTKIYVKHAGILSNGQKDISQGGPKDLIVIDDLIYSEPVKQ